MIRFRSRKSWVFGIFLWFAVLVAFSAAVFAMTRIGPSNYLMNVILALLMIISGGLILWIWFATYYVIADGFLHYRSGPVSGKISIAAINRLEVGKTLWAGVRPALATRGIIIHFNTYDMIYVSPQNDNSFITALKKINPEIKEN
jgi:hypothetical protein